MKLKYKSQLQIELEFLFRQQLNLQTAITDEFKDIQEQNKFFQLYINSSFKTFFCYIYPDIQDDQIDENKLNQNPLFIKTVVMLEETFNELNQKLYQLFQESRSSHSQQSKLLISVHIDQLVTNILSLFQSFNDNASDTLYFD
ncbi:hypothetical protein [Chondrinema litorale]|uniref:hypothetical protein n=1 Tax=Chondrinema litorale TaxID=2994555 RepID=UPI0025438735|nr:hypothetical protein [Chondrinema litorale]UZR99026.1 hypothetical protein OQ292_34065 [Chondrinema litorale]